MKKFIDVSSYSAETLLEELSKAISSGKNNITCVDKEKREMYYVSKMSFGDIVDAVADGSGRFAFYYEEEADAQPS